LNNLYHLTKINNQKWYEISNNSLEITMIKISVI
jgi:hypothetical protein